MKACLLVCAKCTKSTDCCRVQIEEPEDIGLTWIMMANLSLSLFTAWKTTCCSSLSLSILITRLFHAWPLFMKMIFFQIIIRTKTEVFSLLDDGLSVGGGCSAPFGHFFHHTRRYTPLLDLPKPSLPPLNTHYTHTNTHTLEWDLVHHSSHRRFESERSVRVRRRVRLMGWYGHLSDPFLIIWLCYIILQDHYNVI